MPKRGRGKRKRDSGDESATLTAEVVDSATYWDGLGSSLDGYDANVFSSLDECTSAVLTSAMDAYASPAAGIAIDFGCGPGLYLGALRERFRHVVGFDLSPQLVALAQQRVAARACAKGGDSCDRSDTDMETGIHVNIQDLSVGTSIRPAIAQCLTGRAWSPAAAAPCFCVCANVLLSPDAACRARILATMHATLAEDGHVLIVVPSTESRLLMDLLLRRWDDDAWRAEGLVRARLPAGSVPMGLGGHTSARAVQQDRSQQRQRTRRLGLADVLSGVLPQGGTPTQHFLRESLLMELTDAGFDAVTVRKVPYRLETEFDNAPQWMRQLPDQCQRPWDWMAIAHKPKSLCT